MQRRAVVEQQRRLCGERRDVPVPHHPGARRKIENAIAGLDVSVQHVLLEMLQQRPARTVNDALRRPCRTRRKHDEERVIERKPNELDLGGLGTQGEVVPYGSVRQPGDGRIVACVRHEDDTFQRWQRGDDATQRFQAIVCFAVVVVAVDGEQHFRCYLAETIDDALHAEVGRARAPCRAEARAREHRDRGLRHVGKDGRHAIAGPDAAFVKRPGNASDLVVELAMGQPAPHPVLAPEDNRIRVITTAQKVLGEVQKGFRKPARTRHAVAVTDHQTARVSTYVAEVPEQAPEIRSLGDGPGVQGSVVRKLQPETRVRLEDERAHARVPDSLGRGCPEGTRARRHLQAS